MTGNGADPDSGSSAAVTLAGLNATIASLKVLSAQAKEKEFELALDQAHKRLGIPKTKLRKWAEEPDAVPADAEALVLSVEGALKLVDELKPELIIEPGDMPAAVYAIRDALVKAGELYERGVPVRVVPSKRGGLPQIRPLTVENVGLEVHSLYRPVVAKRRGQRRGRGR